MDGFLPSKASLLYNQGPKTVWEVVKLRFKLFKEDVAENWFMINFRKAEVRKMENRLRHQDNKNEPYNSEIRHTSTARNGLDNLAFS